MESIDKEAGLLLGTLRSGFLFYPKNCEDLAREIISNWNPSKYQNKPISREDGLCILTNTAMTDMQRIASYLSGKQPEGVVVY